MRRSQGLGTRPRCYSGVFALFWGQPSFEDFVTRTSARLLAATRRASGATCLMSLDQAVDVQHLFDVGHHDELDATILRTSFFGVVRGDGIARAVARGAPVAFV